MFLTLQFRGPNILKGAFARGILQNNAGHGYISDLVLKNGYKGNLYLTSYVAEQNRKKIKDEELFLNKEMTRRVNVVKEAVGSSYKSAMFN